MKRAILIFFLALLFYPDTSYAAQTFFMDDRGNYFKSGPISESGRIRYHFNTQDLKYSKIEYYHTADMNKLIKSESNTASNVNYYGSTSFHCVGYYRQTFYNSKNEVAISFVVAVKPGDVSGSSCNYPAPPKPNPDPKPDPKPDPNPDPKPDPNPDPDPPYPDYDYDDMDPNADPTKPPSSSNDWDDSWIDTWQPIPQPWEKTYSGHIWNTDADNDVPSRENYIPRDYEPWPDDENAPPPETLYCRGNTGDAWEECAGWYYDLNWFENPSYEQSPYETTNGDGWCFREQRWGDGHSYPCHAPEMGYDTAVKDWCRTDNKDEWKPCPDDWTYEDYERGRDGWCYTATSSYHCEAFKAEDPPEYVPPTGEDPTGELSNNEDDPPKKDDPPKNEDDPSESTCDNCMIFDCPGWDKHLGQLEEIKNAIPPPPDWDSVSETFSDAIVPRLVEETGEMLDDLLGRAPEPPPTLPDLPPLDDRGFKQKQPTMDDPGVQGFTKNDVEGGAPVLPYEEDPTGGFNLSVDPVSNLPDVVPGGDPGAYKRDPKELPATYPGKPKDTTVDVGGAPTPSSSSGTPPSPGESGGAPPQPNDGVAMPGKPNDVSIPGKEHYMSKPGGG